ncbi:MAG: hypothetical protein DWQ09_05645 [Proteobacteria bacterium]|nr:MAG: hypothetical protein DWQ09_05645 [Pseudomonadota bacterium]QKK11430.1 MAG: hypothetical protein HND59_07335 [Pseudomonadota bacterium]
MNSPLLRLLLALAGLVAGGLLAAADNAWGWGAAALGLWLLWEYARDGGVSAAFAAFKRGDQDALRGALRHTLWPRLLATHKRAYYHWMRGVALMATCRFPDAREQLLLAAAGDIQTENDRSLIQCLLAEVSLQLQDWPATQEHLRLARNLEHHERVNGMIDAVEQRLRERVAEAVRAMTPAPVPETQLSPDVDTER